MNTTEQPIQQAISKEELKKAMDKIIARFAQIDPTWKNAGNWDVYGMYSFMTSSKNRTMKQALPDVKHELKLIKRHVAPEFQSKAA